MTLKIRENLRTGSLKPNFTGSYKTKYNMSFSSFAKNIELTNSLKFFGQIWFGATIIKGGQQTKSIWFINQCRYGKLYLRFLHLS